MSDDAPDLMETTRREILRHAEALFGHYGFSKTTMADIAGLCRMSTGNLYRYYRNKQAIGVAVTEAFLRQAEARRLHRGLGLDDPEERIRALLRCSVRLMVAEMERNPKLMEMVEFLAGSEEAWAALETHIAWKRGRIEEELRRGAAAGRFADRPPHETAVNLMHATKAFQAPQALSRWRDRSTILPELEGVLDLVFQGIRAPAC